MRLRGLLPLLVLAACPEPPPVQVDPPLPRLSLVDERGDTICNSDGDCFIDFGDVVKGDVVTRSLFIENSGGADLELPFYAFAGGGDGGFALVDDLPRVVAPGGRAEVVVEFSAGEAGLIGASLLIDDGDEDDDGDVVVFLRAEVVECGERSARIRVLSINGDDVDEDEEEDPIFLVGDQLVLAAEIELCDQPPPADVQWRLLEAAGGFLTFTEDRALLRLDAPGGFLVQATLTAEDGAPLGAPTIALEARRPVNLQFQLTGGAHLHVARDSLDWCSDDDCFAGHCDDVWGLRGERPSNDDVNFSLQDAADGVYTAAGSIDDEGAVTLKAFSDGRLDLEVVRQLRPGEPRLIGRIVVENGVADAIEIDDTSPQPGLCF